jgi:hypothetical protein
MGEMLSNCMGELIDHDFNSVIMATNITNIITCVVSCSIAYYVFIEPDISLYVVRWCESYTI